MHKIKEREDREKAEVPRAEREMFGTQTSRKKEEKEIQTATVRRNSRFAGSL